MPKKPQRKTHNTRIVSQKRSKKIPQTNIKIRIIITLNINALNSSNKRTQTSRLD